MFTGIVEEIGEVSHVITGGRAGVLTLRASLVTQQTKPGDSIAVNGVCLTVTSLTKDGFCADVMPETLRRSNLGSLKQGDRVNLERAMAADGRFGGHIVSGHIDGTGTITGLKREENAVWVTIAAERPVLELIVKKGSVAVDGISLTVSDLTVDGFSVSVIPHTGAQTTLLQKKAGDPVNLENDLIGKYVRRLMETAATAPAQSRISEEFLARYGFM